MSSHYKPESSRQWRGNSYRKGGERIRELRDEDSQATDKEENMPCKVDPKDYTADQKKAVDDFHKLIADKIGVPCIVYDPPPTSCSHTECAEAHNNPKPPTPQFDLGCMECGADGEVEYCFCPKT